MSRQAHFSQLFEGVILMGLVCQLIAQPIITVIHVLVTLVEYVLVQICRLIQELVNVLIQVLQYVCNTVVHTVCSAVCSVVCGICDFFCGIFGCDCGCENVCNNVCNAVTDVVCGWTYVLASVLQWVTQLICTYILKAIITLLDIIETFVTMVLTWACTLIDIFVRGILCWTYLGDIFNNTKPRRFRVAPKIIRNKQGYSDWFVYVNNSAPGGGVDQNVRGYILSDLGRPLMPVVDDATGAIAYYEVVTKGNVITGELKRKESREGGYVAGRPFLYYAYKVMEIASHMWGDIFATASGDDGRGTDFHKNLLTYNPHVQAWLDGDGKLAANNYNAWSGKYTNAASADYFGDLSVADIGLRVDTDACSRPTNTFLHLIHGDIGFTPGDTGVAEDMTCGPGETLSFDDTNFLMINKDSNGAAVTTYFVSKYNLEDTQVGCNDILGYTIVTFEGSQQPLFISMRVLPFDADTNKMMSRIVENISANENIVRVAETYLHECGHQCGLLHDTDAPDCENDTTLHIAKVMNPDADVRRAYTRYQWCMVRLSWYMTLRSLTPFTQAPELPDSGSEPPPAPPVIVGTPSGDRDG